MFRNRRRLYVLLAAGLGVLLFGESSGVASAQTIEALRQAALQSPSALNLASGPAADVSPWLYVVFWIGAGIFLLVEALMLYSVIRFRRRAAGEQALQIRSSTRLELAWTVAPALILVVLLGFTLDAMRTRAPAPSPDPVQVQVIGHRWWWEFRYPQYSAGSARGYVPTSAGDMHVPAGRPVRLVISSTDVMHSYRVPRLSLTIEAFPDHLNVQDLLVDTPGSYPGQCAQSCGDQHAQMRFVVVAQSEADFDAWIRRQPSPEAP